MIRVEGWGADVTTVPGIQGSGLRGSSWAGVQGGPWGSGWGTPPRPRSPLVQITPASSSCLQLLFIQPRDVQLASEGSVPVHCTSSSMMGPLPGGTARTTEPGGGAGALGALVTSYHELALFSQGLSAS